MRPGHFHAPGASPRLPERPVVLDKDGNWVSGGRPQSFQKCLNSLRKHHQEELRSRGK